MFPLYCEALTSPGPPARSVEMKSPVDLRLVEWLMGKLRFRRRCLISSQREQCALLSKVIQAHGSLPCCPRLLFPVVHLCHHYGTLECWGFLTSDLYKQGRTLLYLCPGEQSVEALREIVWCPSTASAPPPALLGYPEPSPVLSDYEWSLKLKDLAGELLPSLGIVLVTDPPVHPGLSQPTEPWPSFGC